MDHFTQTLGAPALLLVPITGVGQTAAGSVAVSHVNDSGFWLVGRLMNMDIPTTFKTWTVMETLIGSAFAWLIFALIRGPSPPVGPGKRFPNLCPP